MARKRVKNRARRANVLLGILSVILAMLVWLVLSITALSEIRVTLREIPIDFSLDNSYADLNGLSVISRDLENVSVSFTGQRDRIGNYTADDIRVSLDLNTVRASGSYDLPLVVTSVNGDQIENIEIAPKRTVHVEFDRFDTKTFSVDDGTLTLDLSNIIPGTGYIIDPEEIEISPSQITISGPQDYIDQVTSCVISFDESMKLTESVNKSTQSVRLMSGNSVFENPRVSLNNDLFNVNIPVYITKTIPLNVSIQSYSDDIDISDINYTLSQASIIVRSQNAAVEGIESITLGTVLLRDIRPGYADVFTIPRSSYYENISGIDEVEVRFNLEGYAEKSVTLKNSQIHLINSPSEYSVTVETDRIQVTLVGPEDILEQIDPSTVVGQIDLLYYDLYTGQRFFNVSVYVPGYPNVWAAGVAQVVTQVEPVQQIDAE